MNVREHNSRGPSKSDAQFPMHSIYTYRSHYVSGNRAEGSTQCRARQAWALATCSLHFHSFYMKCLLCARHNVQTDTKKKDRPSRGSFPEGRVTRPQGVRRRPHMIRLPSSAGLPRSSWDPQPHSANTATACARET